MKQILSLALALLPCLAWAQYPSNGNQKITLGEQTTADGLVFRGVASIDTVTATSKITRANKQDTSAFILLDTTTNLLWHYKTASNGWLQAGGSTFDTTTLNLVSRFATKLNISDTASMLTNYYRSGRTGIIQASDVPTLNQNTTGSAATLTTSRTFQTNLASTSTASFNGSANVTPGVTGTLPVANGGTGSTTQNFVDLTTTQTVAGIKQFTDVFAIKSATNDSFKIEFSPSNTNPNFELYGGSGSDNVGGSAYWRLRDFVNLRSWIGQISSAGNLDFYFNYGGSFYKRHTFTKEGNFGIGTSSPGSRLVVKGVNNTSGESALNVTNSSDASLLFVRNDGNVGIGTTTPNVKLEVKDAIRVNAGGDGFGFQFTHDNANANLNIGYYASNTLYKNLITANYDGNVGIGTASPEANEWNSSARVAHIYQNTTNGAIFKAESSNTKTLLVAGSGIGYLATTTNSPLAFYTNTTEQMRITSGGNVLIGTQTDGGYKLDVNGTGRFSGALSGTSASFSSSITINSIGSAINLIQSAVGSATYYVMQNTVETGGKRYRFGYTGGSLDKGSFSIYNETDNIMPFLISSTGAATFSSSVGIGVAPNVSHNLRVLGATNQQLGLYYDANNYAAIGVRSNGDVQIYGYTSGTGYKNILLGVDGSSVGGNLLIGTLSDNGSRLQVAGAATFSSSVTATRFNPTANTVTGNGMYLPATNSLGFSTNGTQRIHINSAGKVGIGTQMTTAGINDYGNFNVNGLLSFETYFIALRSSGNEVDGNVNFYLREVGDSGNFGTGETGQFEFYSYASNNSINAFVIGNIQSKPLIFGTNNLERVRIFGDGEMNIGYGATDNGAYKLQINGQPYATSSLFVPSDLRFKENIQPLDKGLEIINKLKPVKFNFISTTENNFSEFDEIGFIAQDVEGALSTELFAKAVVKKLDEDKEDSALGLMTEKLIPILVKAIQEQTIIIKQLEQRIINLENK